MVFSTGGKATPVSYPYSNQEEKQGYGEPKLPIDTSAISG